MLASAKAGHDDAIERLYRSCAPLVRGYLRANQVRDADDVTSDVFVSMLTALPTFDGDERSFRSWLLTIAHHRMVDAVRRSQRRPEDPTDPQVGPELPRASSTASRARSTASSPADSSPPSTS